MLNLIKKKLISTILIFSSFLLLGGCAVLPAVPPALSAVGTYFSYQAAKASKIQPTVVPRECYFYQWIRPSCDDREVISEELKDQIKHANKNAVDLCPDFQKPSLLECD